MSCQTSQNAIQRNRLEVEEFEGIGHTARFWTREKLFEGEIEQDGTLSTSIETMKAPKNSLENSKMYSV
jgi:hypothetical protein